MRFLVIDPGYHTGWTVRDDAILVASGRISISAAKNVLPAVYLRQKIIGLIQTYQPEQTWMEKLYPFIREFIKKGKDGKPLYDRRGRIKKVKNIKGSLALAQYWSIINTAVSEYMIPRELDTQRLAKNKIAQAAAREMTGRKKISADEAETIVWSAWLWWTGQIKRESVI